MRTPINDGVLQSDLDCAGFDLLNSGDIEAINGVPAGGVTGQSLTKNSNTDYDTEWTTVVGGSGGLPEGWVSVMDYGAVADGATDDTAAVVAAVADATAIVYFPPGNYFFAGSIGVVPANVSLMGAPFLGPHGNVVTVDPIYTPSNHLSPLAGGTCFLLTDTTGGASGDPFISLSDNSSVTGITFYWPNQSAASVTPTAYPWAIYLGTGAASSVKYCNFVNAYQCIYIENTTFSLVEEVRGQALYRGIRCEGNYDVTRLRGVHFNASWDISGNAGAYQVANSIAFEFGRNDLIIAESCFAFRYLKWMHFYNDTAHNVPPAGGGTTTSTWGQIRGGGGDLCYIGIHIYQAQSYGIDIDGVHLTTSYGVIIESTNSGSVRLHSSIILTFSGAFGIVNGSGEVTVDDCYFFGSSDSGVTPTVFPATGWAVTGTGNFALRDCTFRTTQTHVSIGASIGHAVVTGNMNSGTFTVTNGISTAAIIANNTA